MPDPDGTLTLKLDARYVGRARFRTGGRDDRCLYVVFVYNWRLPSREFECQPETGAQTTIDERISTDRSQVTRAQGNPTLAIQIREYDSLQRVETHPLEIPFFFPVRFQE